MHSPVVSQPLCSQARSLFRTITSPDSSLAAFQASLYLLLLWLVFSSLSLQRPINR